MHSPEEDKLPLASPLGGGWIMEDPPRANWNVFECKRQMTITAGHSALCWVATNLKLSQG